MAADKRYLVRWFPVAGLEKKQDVRLPCTIFLDNGERRVLRVAEDGKFSHRVPAADFRGTLPATLRNSTERPDAPDSCAPARISATRLPATKSMAIRRNKTLQREGLKRMFLHAPANGVSIR